MANSVKSLIKTGFGLGIGVYGAQILFLLLGLIFFIPGYSMFQTAKREETDTTLAFTMMAIGVLIMGGIGFNILLESLGDL